MDVGEGSFTQSEAEFVSQILEEEVLFTEDSVIYLFIKPPTVFFQHKK